MIVPIVEGPGDHAAAPFLIRRVLQERLNRYDITVLPPKKANGKGGLIRDFERFVRYAFITPGCLGVLVLLDADKDCPVTVAKDLASRAVALHPTIPVAIVCARREYESWFVASLGPNCGEAIRLRLALPAGVQYGGAVEQLANPKEWLTQHMPAGRAYRETADQAPLTAAIDFDRACALSRSLRRLEHAIGDLVVAIEAADPRVSPS